MPRLQILIVAEEHGSLFSSVWEGLVSGLKRDADVKFEPEPVKAVSHLLSGTFSTALIVWPEIYLSTLKPNRSLRDYVRNFVKYQGGTALFCGTFSSFVRPATFDLYFESEWQLPWRSGEYHRTTFAMNHEFSLDGNDDDILPSDLQTADLERAYSQKAVHVKGAARNTKLYVPTGDSRIESLVFRPEPITDLTESPAVFQSWGQGHVGFLGDVNSEIGTTKAILALCGLTSGTTLPRLRAGETLPNAGGCENTAFKRCGNCLVCHYCSKICQVAHWSRGHKKECKYMKEEDDDEEYGDEEENDGGYYGSDDNDEDDSDDDREIPPPTIID